VPRTNPAGKIEPLNRARLVEEWAADELRVHQGAGAGEPFTLLPWQRRLLAGIYRRGVTTAAFSVARGAGKTSLVSAVAAAHLVGPAAQPHSEILVVSPSMAQSQILIRSVRALIRPWLDRYGRRFKLIDALGAQRVADRETGVELVARAGVPRSLEGGQPSLILVDEAAALPPNQSEQIRGILETSLGKIPGARMVALSTWPADNSGWFSAWCGGEADYAQVHRGDPDAPIHYRRQWTRANPSLRDPRFAPLLAETARHARKAATSEAQAASFRARRLNLGGDLEASRLVLPADVWAGCARTADRAGGYVLGIDLAGHAGMTAAAAYWPETGRVEVHGWASATIPVDERDARAGHGRNAYLQRAAELGELTLTPQRIPPLTLVLEWCRDTWGVPGAVTADAYRAPALRDALDECGFRPARTPLRQHKRSESVLALDRFRGAVDAGRVADPTASVLLRMSLRNARTHPDGYADGDRLARGGESGKSDYAPDDALAALILAVSLAESRGARARRRAA